MFSTLLQPKPVGKYIVFEDPEVERMLMSKGVSSDGIGITLEDAAKVTTIGAWFINSGISAFEEFQYFTKVTALGFTYGTSNNGFYQCGSLKKLKLPASVKTIGVRTLNATRFLKSLGLDNVTTISDGAFGGSAIEEINAPILATLGTNVFMDCTGLKKITSLGNITIIPAGGIGYGTFKGCTSLEEADLPSTLTNIGNNAFNGCSALVKVVCRAATPPTLGTGQAFNNAVIYVPDASFEAYKTATNWSAYADRIHPLSEIEGSLVLYDKLVGDGTAYIKTEYYPNGTDGFAWSADRPINWNKFIFGCKSSALNLGVLPINESQTYYLVGSAGATAVTEDNRPTITRELIVTQIDGSLHRVLVDNGVQTKDFGAVGSYEGKTSSAPLLLFSCQTNATNATADRIYNGTIRSFSINDIDGNTIMSLKPCTWNGEAGMWDEVNGKFYGNAATSGEFSVAND